MSLESLTRNWLHVETDFRHELQAAQNTAKTGAKLDVYGWSSNDARRVYQWLHDSLAQAAQRNHSHIYWSWTFIQRQLENILHEELYMFESTSPDICWFSELLKDFCENLNLELEVTDYRVIIGWASDDDMR